MDRDGRSPLHYRALEGDLDGVRQRVAAGDGVDQQDKAGFAPLHFAAQQSQVAAVALLLELGATVDVRDGFGNTPLWRAVFSARGDASVVRRLLDAGADPDLANDSGVSPRQLARQIQGADAIVAAIDEADQRTG